jgi:hypothetical protein
MTRILNVPSIAKTSLDIVRQNTVLMAPTIISIGLSIAVTITIASSVEGYEDDVRSLFLQLVLAVIMNIYAHGVTVAMAWEVRERGSTSLSSAGLIAWRLMPRILPVSLLIGLSFSIGLFMFILPGMAIALFFMYTMPAMVVKNLNAFDAISESFKVIKEEVKNSLGLIGMLALTSLGLGVMSVGFILIPILGPLLNVALSAAFTAMVSVLLLQAYLLLSDHEKNAQPAQPEA